MPRNSNQEKDMTIDMAQERAQKKKTAAAHFGDFVEGELRSNEIEEGLSEIYQDDNGQIVDMKNVEIEHGRSWLYRVFIWLLNVSLILVLVWVGYYFFHQYRSANDTASVELMLSGPAEAIAGQEIEYTVVYKNLDRIDLKNVNLKVTYPENFIFSSAEAAPSQGNDVWNIGNLEKRRSGQIKIKGVLVGLSGSSNVALATLSYMPANFSSEFKKDSRSETVITSTGLDFNFDFPQNVLVGDQNDLYIAYRQLDQAHLANFRITVGKLDNLSFGTSSNVFEPGVYNVAMASSTTGSPTASGTSPNAAASGLQGELRIPLTFTSRVNNTENLSISFDYTPDGQKFYNFFKKDIPVDVLSKSVNLDLMINASKDNQGVDFGQALNYSITYANKGDQALKNLVVMAILDSDFLDWQTLKDGNKGKVSNNKIIWTKDELPSLAEVGPGQEGTIDFAINVMPAKDINPVKNYQVKSYARFALGDASSTKESATDRSNEITNKINSDLSLKEEVRYFDDDNIAVGSGPQPPKVGQTTSYKVYWKLTNSLNELNNLRIETTLPAYISFDGKNQGDLGAVSFDQASRKVIWDIGKLPITTAKADAQFNIAVTPTSTDANKIMILLNDANVTATDVSTGQQIVKKIKAKTSKLADDPAVTDDGLVVQ